MKNQSIAVIGAGGWGTALSIILSEKGHAVDLWVYEDELCEIISSRRENVFFLPGFPLSEKIRPSRSIEEVVGGHAVVFLAVPTHVMRRMAERLAPLLGPGTLVVNASKGIENDSLLTIHRILREVFKNGCRIGSISGPTFAREIARHVPSAMVAAADNHETAAEIRGILSTPQLKIFVSSDLLGVELGGALKNVIAIATGIADGLELGCNARAALITRGLVEITRIGTALGARSETFSGLSGLGDLVLTCTGDLSRNRSVGMQLGQGRKLRDITAGMKMVAEGVLTVKSAYDLKNRLNIQASIIEETYKVLYEDKSPRQALNDLLKVEISTEFSGIKGLE
jgi:glycerol-3-phosphate dehydrogenase (NAD(P)+)